MQIVLIWCNNTSYIQKIDKTLTTSTIIKREILEIFQRIEGLSGIDVHHNQLELHQN